MRAIGAIAVVFRGVIDSVWGIVYFKFFVVGPYVTTISLNARVREEGSVVTSVDFM